MAVIYIYIYNLKMCGDLRLFFLYILLFQGRRGISKWQVSCYLSIKEGVGCKVLGMQFLLPAKIGPL